MCLISQHDVVRITLCKLIEYCNSLSVFRWAILFSHPKDYTPVCTTELSKIAVLYSEFVKRDVKLAALSCDDVEDHKEWSKVGGATRWDFGTMTCGNNYDSL